MKRKRSALLKRKACVMKKTMELSVLCDVKICAIIIDEDGTVETWPKNHTDLIPLLDQYRTKHPSEKKKQSNNVDVVDENPNDVLSKLNSKIEAVKNRIEFLKGESIVNRVGDEEKEEFNEFLNQILNTSAAAAATTTTVDHIQEISVSDEQQCQLGYCNGGQIEQKFPLEYYWDGQIGFSDDFYDAATANNFQPIDDQPPFSEAYNCVEGQIEQEFPQEYYWDGQIGFSHDCYAAAATTATANYEQPPFSEAYNWDLGTETEYLWMLQNPTRDSYMN